MKKIAHVGIAVEALEEAIETYKALGFNFHGVEEVPTQKVRTAFFDIGESHVELLEATEEDSPIAKFLNKRGPGIHHLSIEVDDIEAALTRCKAAGLKIINEQPVIGAGGHRVAFVHPKTTHGVLLEFMEVCKTEAPH